MSPLTEFQDSLLDALAADSGEYSTVVLASVHRPTFTQQLTVLHGEVMPLAVACAAGKKSALRELDLPN